MGETTKYTGTQIYSYSQQDRKQFQPYYRIYNTIFEKVLPGNSLKFSRWTKHTAFSHVRPISWAIFQYIAQFRENLSGEHWATIKISMSLIYSKQYHPVIATKILSSKVLLLALTTSGNERGLEPPKCYNKIESEDLISIFWIKL